MCAIFGSYDQDMFYELMRVNSYRGSYSYSISYYDGKKMSVVEKDFGTMPEKDLEPNYFYIGHVQAPTTDSKDATSIHPANDRGDYLWHNGIIKDYQVKKWQSDWKKEWVWDTKWLLYLLNSGGLENVLSEADGSFACLWYGKYNPSLYLFRNDNCPMFIDGHDFSSTKFDNSESIESGQFYTYNIEDGWIKDRKTFETKNKFYWSAE
jgi:glutamine phosphoribosylpyrophosphate amidotransferase